MPRAKGLFRAKVSDKISLPVKDGEPNYEIMKDFISATQKLVIKDVVHFADSKIEATKLVSNKMN